MEKSQLVKLNSFQVSKRKTIAAFAIDVKISKEIFTCSYLTNAIKEPANTYTVFAQPIPLVFQNVLSLSKRKKFL